MRRTHDHDAGGSPELLAAKAELRQEVWDALRAAKATRFPGPEGRIPNFVGAEAAAERLRSTDVWRAAGTLKSSGGHGAGSRIELMIYGEGAAAVLSDIERLASRVGVSVEQVSQSVILTILPEGKSHSKS